MEGSLSVACRGEGRMSRNIVGGNTSSCRLWGDSLGVRMAVVHPRNRREGAGCRRKPVQAISGQTRFGPGMGGVRRLSSVGVVIGLAEGEVA